MSSDKVSNNVRPNYVKPHIALKKSSVNCGYKVVTNSLATPRKTLTYAYRCEQQRPE